MKRFTGFALGTLLISGLTLAHAEGEHVMGTVKSVQGETLTVETAKERKQVAVHVDERTRLEKSGAEATLKELQVGSRVVVHAMKHGELLHATLVKFGKPSTGTPSTIVTSDGGTPEASHDHAH